uniref:Uncharacterized protein n=1 Tax=Steinernema glaseri TaxID=37863 RepID=A0A1I7YCH4_9BILA
MSVVVVVLTEAREASPANRKLVEADRPSLRLGGPQRRREPSQDEGGGRVLESEEAPPGPGDELAHG